uniref:Transmembrane protein 120A n=1 Tax=Eptatretus burgeri TaxID=7764 RepID=A0A8C4QWQ9_EPTBU
MADRSLTETLSEWNDLQKGNEGLQQVFQKYLDDLQTTSYKQSEISSNIARQHRHLADLAKSLKYLSLVLGNLNVTLFSKQAKFSYKVEYENFKLYLTCTCFLLTLALRLWNSYKTIDTLLNFLLVWYYCTLTIRESILVLNGSRIKGWWVTHHYISTFLTGVMLTWPDSIMYQKFRLQYLDFCIYLSLVQFLQYYYQSGSLYRLRALGQRRSLDITVEGFQSWMWRGLTFLLPVLFFGHFWQLYNAITLYEMACECGWQEWQVPVQSFTYLLLFVGNFSTTLRVLLQKLREKRQKIS